MTNRIIQHLHCDCCRKRQRDERLQILCNDLQMIVDSESLAFLHRDGEIHAAVILELEETSDAEHAALHFADELRDAADQLNAAADALEGGSHE